MTSSGRVVIFDTDGTLMDGRHAVIDAVAEALIATYEHFELPVPAIDRERISLAMGLPSTTFFRAAFDAATVAAELRDAFASEFEVLSVRAEVAALRRGESQLYDGAQETLTALRERGHDLALFSNASEPYFQAVIEVHGLERWFSRTLSLEFAVRRRLARHKTGMVRHLARGYADVVVVGDRVHDIEAGRALGARTIGCRFGFGEPDELDRADWTIGDLREILALPLDVAGRPGTNDAREEARG
ncbi:MAG TPA: HAD family hydrolase [Candidatus Krumholzibacteria bacterium]|nr:HAD family hydrolase [Candidatus Krumholzibacteria bacterium]HPD72408.1 HAD family hydrolase [Candidatus Krumholzibacteria bacterium]HRY40660.1 HAD family hydrolase [Candidatus Krumholzibacteria bacterium]